MANETVGYIAQGAGLPPKPAPQRDDGSADRKPLSRSEPANDDGRVAERQAAKAEMTQQLLQRLEGGRLMPNTKLSIDRDPDSGKVIYRSVNMDTGEVIRQYPSEDALKVMQTMRLAEGFLIDRNV